MHRFREIEHTADWAFRVRGRDLTQLFSNAASAMFELQGITAGGETNSTRAVLVAGVDRETLLVNWLNELLYLQETQQETYSRFEILEISDTQLRARVHGQQGRHGKLIKAVTFHDLKITPTKKGWEATIVVDV